MLFDREGRFVHNARRAEETVPEPRAWGLTDEERAFFKKMGLTTEKEMLFARSIPMHGDCPPYPTER